MKTTYDNMRYFYKSDLHQHTNDDYGKVVDQVEEEPNLHRLDIWSSGKVGGSREVDRGQHHHDGNIDSEDHVILVVSLDVHRSLVDQVHQQ